MTTEYKGEAHLLIWAADYSKYFPLSKENLCLLFQPQKGMKLTFDDQIWSFYEIHDIRWDINSNRFSIQIIEIEHPAGEDFIGAEYLIEEAEKSGWVRPIGEAARVRDKPDKEFIEHCFPNWNYNSKYAENLEREIKEERFVEAVLNALTDLKEENKQSKTTTRYSILIGAIVAISTYLLINRVF